MKFQLLNQNRNFRKLWVGQLVSAFGDRMTQMGLLTFVMVFSADKGTKMALITFFTLLPFLLFGPLFGAITDRYSRKKIMIIADVARAIIVVLIPLIWINTHSVAIMLVAVFTLGTFSALFSPAKMSIIPNLVEKDDLVEANSLVITTGMVATLIGTLVAGAIIKLSGVRAGFYINSATYLISALLVVAIIYRTYEKKLGKIKDSYQSLVSDIKEGVSYIYRHHLIMRLIQLSTIFSLITSFAYILILNYATTVLKKGPLGIGVLLSCAGLGMIIGSLILIKRKDRINYTRALYLSFLIVSLGLFSFLARPDIYITSLVLIFAGVGLAILTIALDTILQRIVPNQLKGKIFGARGMLTNSVFLSSLLAVGFLIKFINVRILFGLVGLISLSTSLFIYLSEVEWGYQLLRIFLRLAMKLLFDFRVSGLENLPQKEKVILAGNHTSLIDGVAVMCAYPHRVYFIAAQSLFEARFWGWCARQLGFIPVRRGDFNKEALRESFRILKCGHSIGIFPEGKITEDGRLTEGKRGVAVIAQETNAPIIPFAIEGVYEAWPRDQKFPKRFPIEVRFGKPIDIKEYKISEELTGEVMQEIAQIKLEMEREGYLRVDPQLIVRHLINV